jgi:hypothetical protein
MLETLAREENQKVVIQLNHDGLLKETRVRSVQETTPKEDANWEECS